MIGRLKDHSFEFENRSISNVSRGNNSSFIFYEDIFGEKNYYIPRILSAIITTAEQVKGRRNEISEFNDCMLYYHSHIIRPFKKYKSINYFQMATIRSKCKRKI